MSATDFILHSNKTIVKMIIINKLSPFQNIELGCTLNNVVHFTKLKFIKAKEKIPYD